MDTTRTFCGTSATEWCISQEALKSVITAIQTSNEHVAGIPQRNDRFLNMNCNRWWTPCRLQHKHFAKRPQRNDELPDTHCNLWWTHVTIDQHFANIRNGNKGFKRWDRNELDVRREDEPGDIYFWIGKKKGFGIWEYGIGTGPQGFGIWEWVTGDTVFALSLDMMVLDVLPKIVYPWSACEILSRNVDYIIHIWFSPIM